MRYHILALLLVTLLSVNSVPNTTVLDLNCTPPDNDYLSEDSTLPSIPVIIERVDIPLEEAVKDPSYFNSHSSVYATGRSSLTRDTTWVVSGRVQFSQEYNDFCQAVGVSAEYDGDTLLQTHHYTRTFFGTASNNIGDSGRVWGDGKVWAFGSLVHVSNTFYRVQRVFYGTAS